METEPPSCVYDAAIVMAKFIEKNIEGASSVVELGAGCGFSSIFLAKKTQAIATDAKVFATDLENVVQLIDTNIKRNDAAENVKALPLFWGN